MSKITASAMGAILFFILASPEAFALVQSLLGDLVRVASAGGVPTLAGLLIHSLVYGAITLGLMQLGKKKWGKNKWGKNKWGKGSRAWN